MKAMKRFAIFIFMLVFVVNGVMLAAKANACTMERGSVSVSQVDQADMPDCHKSQDQQNQQKPKGDHCDGVCFCKHVGAVSHILSFAENITPYHRIAVEQVNTPQAFVHVIDRSNLFRPPIFIS